MTDDNLGPQPHRATLLLYRCARCSGLTEVPTDDAEAELRARIEGRDVWEAHACSDGAHGVSQLIGTGPARAMVPRYRSAENGKAET